MSDNRNRGRRVEQLVNDIENLQQAIKEAVADARKHDNKSIEFLNKVARERGFQTLDEYIADSISKLTPEDKERYRKMKEELERKDEGVDISLKVGAGMTGVGIISVSLSLFFQRQLVFVAFRAIAVGLLKLITGQATAGLAILRGARNIFKSVVNGQATVGKAATAFKALKTLGKFLSILGIIIETATLVFDLVDGAKQRAQLQQATKELCVARFQVKKTQQYTRATLDTLQKLVADGTITQAKANELVKKKIDEWIPNLKKSIDSIKDKEIYDGLKKFDTDRQAWTNEDPSYDYIQAEIKKINDKS
ncbi:hypothetical protein AMATHDRAFT_43051 [Amanita thiersii Skay4041]|uniref:Uncharacterized protein n=1 Tax=Amanita thiersii Skay4041 TaxID=703135 RepID=A0A2A9NHY7_9AGAR|nr:hypothetical protein AMATHDRAFT_43051 [Amanita thiersii Skay4041]